MSNISRIALYVLLSLVWVLFYGHVARAACSSPISRTNNAANSVLTSSKYNSDLNTAYSHVNDLDGDCITAGTINNAALDSSEFAVPLNAITRGFRCSRSDINTISISKGWISVDGNYLTTTSATTVTWGCTGCSSESTGAAFYVALQTGTSVSPIITTTAPNADGYNGTNKYICKFWNDQDSKIATNSISQWVVNNFYPDKSHISLRGHNGAGSSNTAIPIWNNPIFAYGDGWTFTQSNANGDSFTFNRSGFVTLNLAMSDATVNNCFFGVSVNSSELSTSVKSIQAKDLPAGMQGQSQATDVDSFSANLTVSAGDVLRPHFTSASTCDSQNKSRFNMHFTPSGVD